MAKHLLLTLICTSVMTVTSCLSSRWDCTEVYGVPKDTKKHNCIDGKDRKRGWFFEYYNDYLQEKTKYRKGVKQGRYERYHKNGNIYEIGKYKKGERHGRWVSFWSDSTIMIVDNYKKGSLEGWRYIYVPLTCPPPCPKEKISLKEYYVNGKREGKTYQYDLDGNLQYILIYKNDSIVQTLYP